MIEPEVKSEIRNSIVRANLALHRGEVDNLTKELTEALATANRIRHEQQPVLARNQPKLF